MTTPMRVVVLTGAGISAESGIATFRGSGGLWENQRIEDVASPVAFSRNPEAVHRFYNLRRVAHEQGNAGGPVLPNAAHHALSEFQKRTRGSFVLITQNVDALHERAGCENVLHMHGELLKVRCVATSLVYPWRGECTTRSVCDCCGLPGRLRPHIVWFGEVPFHLHEIERALLNCDLFVAIGTSGQVYPAAGFVQIARSAGARTVELNLEPSANASNFDDVRQGPGTTIVPAFFRELA